MKNFFVATYDNSAAYLPHPHAIQQKSKLFQHVIPRPDAELAHILLLQPRSIEIEAAAPAEAAQEGQTSMAFV